MLWLVLRIGILSLTCAAMPVSRAIRLAMFGVATLSAPVLFDLNLGNISLIVTFLAVLTWRWLDRPIAGRSRSPLSLTHAPDDGPHLLAGGCCAAMWRPVAWTAIAGLAFCRRSRCPSSGSTAGSST